MIGNILLGAAGPAIAKNVVSATAGPAIRGTGRALKLVGKNPTWRDAATEVGSRMESVGQPTEAAGSYAAPEVASPSAAVERLSGRNVSYDAPVAAAAQPLSPRVRIEAAIQKTGLKPNGRQLSYIYEKVNPPNLMDAEQAVREVMGPQVDALPASWQPLTKPLTREDTLFPKGNRGRASGAGGRMKPTPKG